MALSQTLKHLLVRLLPNSGITRLKDFRRAMRRRQWEKHVQNNEEVHFSKSELIDHLRAIGVEEGRDLILHSSMRKIGFVKGGAPTMIEALQTVLGPNATLLMPAYPLKTNTLDTMKDPTPFDMTNDRSYMGKITEIFRTRPDAYRSGHPTHSVAAVGPRAKEYTAGHHTSISPCGPLSPFQLLSKYQGQVLSVGVGIGKITSHHTIEDLVEDFPLNVYHAEILSKTVIFPDGHREDVQAKVHRAELSRVRVDNDPVAEKEVYDWLKAADILKEGKIGDADGILFRADALDSAHADRLQKEGNTIYRRDAI